MEEEQDLVGLVLAAAQRKIRGIPAGKQADLDRAVLVGRERLRVVLPEVLHADGQSLGRVGHVEPAQRPLAGRCLRRRPGTCGSPGRSRSCSAEDETAGPGSGPSVRRRWSPGRSRPSPPAEPRAGGLWASPPTQTRLGRPSRERQAQGHLVEEDAVDAADVGIAGVAVRRAPAVVVVLQREGQLHAPAAGVEVIPGRVLQDRRTRPDRESLSPGSRSAAGRVPARWTRARSRWPPSSPRGSCERYRRRPLPGTRRAATLRRGWTPGRPCWRSPSDRPRGPRGPTSRRSPRTRGPT